MFRMNFSKLNSLTVLISISVVFFLVPQFLSVWFGQKINSSNLYEVLLLLLGALQGQLVVSGEWWRIVTSTFLHANLLHLAFNMWSLWKIGQIVYEYYGGKSLFSFYMISGIAGSIISVIFIPSSFSVGASGAVFGLVGVLVAGSMRNNTYGISLPFSPGDVLPIAIYAFLIGLVPGSSVNNWAHLGGFVAGLLLGQMIGHEYTTWRPGWVKYSQLYLFYVCVFIALLSFLLMGYNALQTLTI